MVGGEFSKDLGAYLVKRGFAAFVSRLSISVWLVRPSRFKSYRAHYTGKVESTSFVIIPEKSAPAPPELEVAYKPVLSILASFFTARAESNFGGKMRQHGR